jgi:N-methylhydantoinase B
MIADDRMLLQPFGAAGGKAAAGSIYILNPGTEREQVVPTKTDYLPIKTGDLLRVMTTGGGGWGDPLERDPAKVLEDVSLGLVSAAAAEKDYGVVIDGTAMTVCSAETAKLRREIRRTREPLRIIDRGERFRKLREAKRITLTSEDPVLEPQVGGDERRAAGA